MHGTQVSAVRALAVALPMKRAGVQPPDIEPAPCFGAKIRTELVAGIGKFNGKFIILDVGKLLSVEDIAAISATDSNPQAKDTQGALTK